MIIRTTDLHFPCDTAILPYGGVVDYVNVPSPKPALDGSKQLFAIWIVLYYLISSSRYRVLENTPS